MEQGLLEEAAQLQAAATKSKQQQSKSCHSMYNLQHGMLCTCPTQAHLQLQDEPQHFWGQSCTDHGIVHNDVCGDCY